MWISFIIAVIAVLIDQVVKLYFEYSYATGEINVIIKNFFYLTKTYNTGAGWSMFNDNTAFLTILSLVASFVISYIIYKYVTKFKIMKVFSIGMGLVLGGTFGNFIDRFLTTIGHRAGVIDFVGVYIGSYEYPIFNLADSFLVVGVILILIDVLFFMEKRKKNLNEVLEEKDSDENE